MIVEKEKDKEVLKSRDEIPIITTDEKIPTEEANDNYQPTFNSESISITKRESRLSTLKSNIMVNAFNQLEANKPSIISNKNTSNMNNQSGTNRLKNLKMTTLNTLNSNYNTISSYDNKANQNKFEFMGNSSKRKLDFIRLKMDIMKK